MTEEKQKNPYTEQIMRCSSLQKFPLYPQGVKELKETLRSSAQTPSRAERVIDKVMAERDTCPTPKELRQLAGEVLRAEDAAPTGCEICNGEPWVTVSKQIRDAITGELETRLGSKRCHCAKGQWFRMKDAENKAKRDAGQPV